MDSIKHCAARLGHAPRVIFGNHAEPRILVGYIGAYAVCGSKRKLLDLSTESKVLLSQCAQLVTERSFLFGGHLTFSFFDTSHQKITRNA